MSEIPTYFLYPSTLYISKKPVLVTTILGSCVSVCMWDKELKAGGINHFMLPIWSGNGLASPKYGDIAIDKLFTKMLSLGCKKANLISKVFGGGEVLGKQAGKFAIPERNIEIAENTLKRLKIPVISRNTGGFHGRKIFFETHTGIVRMKIIPKREEMNK